MASLLAILAIVTLAIKSLIEWRIRNQEHLRTMEQQFELAGNA
jgi:ABC-type sulfate transport system permease subunit